MYATGLGVTRGGGGGNVSGGATLLLPVGISRQFEYKGLLVFTSL